MPHQPLVLAIAAAAATLLGGAFAGSQPEPTALRLADADKAPAPAGLACEIRDTARGQSRRLEAIVRGAEPVAGDYRFAVTSRGRGSSSRSAQNGTFELERRRQIVLGQIGLDADADYDARVTLTLPDGEVVCEARN